MNAAAPIQTRLVMLLGIVALLGLAAFMFLRGGLVDSDESTASPAPLAQTPAAPKRASTPVAAAAKPAAAKAVVLSPGLPANLARALRRERVVVAAVYAPGANDRVAVAQSRAGARQVGAGFVALNVLREDHARSLESLVGPISDPSVLVFKRPGIVVQRLDGFADTVTVAQAAHDAGAR